MFRIIFLLTKGLIETKINCKFVLTDVDECREEMTLCSQKCQNTPGSFLCSCLEGYILHHENLCKANG